MNSAWLLLSLFSVNALSSCAFGMGVRHACDMPTLPERPLQELCIVSSDGSAGCYDPRKTPASYIRSSVTNYIATPGVDNQTQEEWIKALKSAVGQ